MAKVVTTITLALAWLLMCGTQLEVNATRRKAARVVTQSSCVVLRATHILLVSVRSARVEPWQPDTPRTQRRKVTLELRLDRVLKGNVAGPGPTPLRIEVVQMGRIGGRIFAVPGVWSDKPLHAGDQYVVFCESASSRATVVLLESSTLRVAAADEVLADVELALTSESFSLPNALRRLQNRRSSVGPLFGEYISARLDEVMFQHADDFDRVMSFLEAPGLPERFRGLVVGNVYSKLLAADPVPLGFASRLAVASFRIVALPDAANLRENLLQTYLPNLVGLEGGARSKSADEVFAAYPRDRDDAEQTLEKYQGDAAASSLLAWLRRH